MAQPGFEGSESWVVATSRVDELCGHHARLMAGAIEGDECVRSIVYAPLREVGGGPFGMAPLRGSHAIALTDRALIITRDPHDGVHAPDVARVLRHSVVCCTLGEALTLGWLVVTASGPAGPERHRAIFASSGIRYIREIVCALRGDARPPDASPGADPFWPRLWSASPPYLSAQLSPLLVAGERPLAVVAGAETWEIPRRSTPRCASTAAMIVATDHGLLVARSDAPPRPGTLVFGVEVHSICWADVRAIAAEEIRVGSSATTVCAITIDQGAGTWTDRVPIGARTREEVARLLAPLTRRTARAS